MHLSSYSNISELYRLFYSIPLTSVEPERIFSHADIVCTKLRSSLSMETIDSLLFLSRSNFNFTIDEYKDAFEI